MATLEGAKVLGLDEKIGSLEVGKCADVIRISTRAPRMNPIYDIYAALVFSANASDIRDVMIHGQWVVQNRVALTLEQPKVLSDAAQTARQFGQIIDQIDAAKTP
jgi:cytosine/adenosine deaminase-related metal-dependent hydrolase